MSFSQQGRAYTRALKSENSLEQHDVVGQMRLSVHTSALKSEKSLSRPIPVCGGAVVTNDWCITYNR